MSEISVVNRNELYRNELVTSETWQGLLSNQKWIYGRVSPIAGEDVTGEDIDRTTFFEKMIVSRKPRSSSGAVETNYNELLLVLYGSNHNVSWTVRDKFWAVVETVFTGAPATTGFDVTRVDVTEGDVYYIECASLDDGGDLRSAFVAWPFLDAVEDFPK